MLAPVLTAADVFDAAELGRLALNWAGQGSHFAETDLNRYRHLCGYYGVSEATLLHAAQALLAGQSEPTVTRVFPALADAGPDPD